jgi:FkbM family methyltransferase
MVEASAVRLDAHKVAEAQTVLGPLWVERSAEIVTRSLIEEGIWDLAISGLMTNLLRPGMTFVDTGANIGYFSVLGSRLVGPEGRVFAVEPDPLNQSILRANLSRHECSNVTVLPIAAWSERTELDFHRPAEDGATARVGQDDGSGARVQADRLDALVEGPVHYVKVDCELSDHVVVRGLEGLFRKNPSLLISVEFCPWLESHLGATPSEILDQYREMGLHPYRIVAKGIRATTWEQIADPSLPDDHIAFDFVMSRCGPPELKARGMIASRTLLEWGGDMLDYVPESIRPPIRQRDRRARREG